MGESPCVCLQHLHCLQVASKLPAAEAELGQVRSQLQQAQRAAAEIPTLREHLRAQDRAAEQAASNWARERAVMERQLAAAGRERDQLSEQVILELCCMECAPSFQPPRPAADKLPVRSCSCGLHSCRAAAACA